jgi:solute:Na+ symporter, SSS family
VGIGMTLLAMGCAAAFDPKASILSYVLSLMTFAYSGMLGVFLTALFTKRGNVGTVIAALVVGVVVSLALHMRITPMWTPWVFGKSYVLAWPWTMPAATVAAFLVCVAGRGRRSTGGEGR